MNSGMTEYLSLSSHDKLMEKVLHLNASDIYWIFYFLIIVWAKVKKEEKTVKKKISITGVKNPH